MIESALTLDNIRRHITTIQIDNIIDHPMKSNSNQRYALLASSLDLYSDKEIDAYNEKNRLYTTD